MRTCGMICVTLYVVEEHSGVSKTGFKCMGWRRIGIGTEMKRYERLPWRGVRHMGLPVRNKGMASWVSLDATPATMGKRMGSCRGHIRRPRRLPATKDTSDEPRRQDGHS